MRLWSSRMKPGESSEPALLVPARGFVVDGGGTAAAGAKRSPWSLYDALILELLGFPDGGRLQLLLHGCSQREPVPPDSDGPGRRGRPGRRASMLGPIDYFGQPFAVSELLFAHQGVFLRRPGHSLGNDPGRRNLAFDTIGRDVSWRHDLSTLRRQSCHPRNC